MAAGSHSSPVNFPLVVAGFIRQATWPRTLTWGLGQMIQLISNPMSLQPVIHLHYAKFVEKDHVILKCWNRLNNSYQLNDIPQALVAMTLKNISPEEWIASTGVFAHITGNPCMLNNLCHYFDSDIVIIGDTYINNGTNEIKLKDVLQYQH